MEVWPSQLQQKLNVDSFTVVFGNTLVKSETDVGPAKVRSRYTDAVDLYSCTIDLDYDDYDVLYDFYKTTLNNGAKTFSFVNPFTLATDEFRFLDPIDIRPLGGRLFRVNMKWERMPG
jgi:hypothetical protein